MPLDPPLTITRFSLMGFSLPDRAAGAWYARRRMPVWRIAVAGVCLWIGASGCASSGSGFFGGFGAKPRPGEARTLKVTATAYNSLHGQGSGDPTLTAWGDRLEPGMKAIAVSPDLIALGLTHGTAVEIDGAPGRWIVRDKMARRWKRRIDLYMGVDRRAALQWGRRPVTIRWTPDPAP